MRLACLIALSAGVCLFAQDQIDRRFETQVNYVRVDMYPTAGGKPVTDLTESDLELLEDGRPQQIVQFEHVSLSGRRPQSLRAEPATVDDVRRAAQDPRSRVFVLFLDPRHVDVQGSATVRQPLIDTLDKLIGGDDLIAVMTPEMSARALTFTRRTGSIEQMLERFWGKADWVVNDGVETRYELCYAPPIIDGPMMARAMINRRREVMVLNAFEDLIQSLRVLREERKAVITISDGWPLYGPDRSLTKPLLTPTLDPDRPGSAYIPIPGVGKDPITGRPTTKPPSDSFSNDGGGPVDRASCEVDRYDLADINNEQRFIELMQAANRANVSFYPVAPGFWDGYMPMKAEARPPSQTESANRSAIQTERRNTSSARRHSLQTMADMTDGRAALEAEFMKTGFRRIVEDLSSYYLVGYYSDGKADGRFHKIDVRVRRPGVQVRARAGYLAATAAEAAAAASPGVSSPDVTETQLVRRAVNALAALSRERPLRVQATVAWSTAGTPVVRAVAEATRIAVRGDDWGKGAHVDATLLDASGARVASGQAAIAPGSYVGALMLTPRTTLSPGDYTLRVRAKGTEVISPGVEELRVKVPAAPAGSGAAYFRRGPGTGNREAATADARFRRAERLVIEVPAAGGETLGARVLDRTGKPLSLPLTTATREDAGGVRWHRVEAALAPLAQGDYVMELSAGAERTLTGFRVVP